jgi:hypothetical protein
MVMSPVGFGPENDCAGKARSNCKRQARPLVREDAPHQQTRKCLTEIKIWSQAPDGCLTPRQTGRLTVGRSCVVGYSPDGKDASRGHCQDSLPGNE